SIVGSGNDMPQVANDSIDEKHLAVVVVVETPGVGRALSDDFEDLAGGMIAPDATVDRYALRDRGTGLADERRRQNSMPAVEPAIGAPFQAVDDVVPDGAFVPSVEQYDRLAVGNIVAIGVGNEE